MKYLLDKIFSKLQDTKWFWRYFGGRIWKMRGVYAVQFARSYAWSCAGYSTSGDVDIFVDKLFLTRKLAEKVYEECVPKYKTAKEIGEGYRNDDDLVLWEYDNGYTKELQVFPNP